MCKKKPNKDKIKKNRHQKYDFGEFFCIFDEFLLPLQERSAICAIGCRWAT
jgi:hypothetical protein